MNAQKSTNLIRIIYGVCLAGASYNHARIVHQYGVAWDYGGVSPFLSAFWTSLTFFDPLAVFLLMVKPRAGLAATAAIIVTDVVANTFAGLSYGFDWPSFAAQFAFMVFVLSTVRPAWRALADLGNSPS